MCCYGSLSQELLNHSMVVFYTNSSNRSKNTHTWHILTLSLSLLASDSHCHGFAADYYDTLPIEKHRSFGIVAYHFCLKFGDLCYKGRHIIKVKSSFVLVQIKERKKGYSSHCHTLLVLLANSQTNQNCCKWRRQWGVWREQWSGLDHLFRQRLGTIVLFGN